MNRAGLESRLVSVWYGSTRPPPGLRLLALIFRAASAVRRAAYRYRILPSRRVGVPVVVIGNITVGGSGKTPLTIWLAEVLSERGLKVGVVTRGYGGAARDWPREVTPASAAADVGDEALLLARRTGCPVVAAPDRAAAAARLLERHRVDVVIADDGLQHYALARDFEIAVVDGRRGLGNGRLLPAGPLREPASRLDSVDCVVVKNPTADSGAHNARTPSPLRGRGGGGRSTASARRAGSHGWLRWGFWQRRNALPKTGWDEGERRVAALPDCPSSQPSPSGGRGGGPASIGQEFACDGAISMTLVPGAARSLATGTTRSLESFAGTPVHAVAGIADPEQFFTALRAHGLTVMPHPLPDHAALTPSDLDFGDGLPVLMTEKDAVKVVDGGATLWTVAADAALAAEPAGRLLARIVALTGSGTVS